MNIKFRQISRKLHLWFSLLVVLPALIIFASGILLQVKKQSDWVQPPTTKGMSDTPTISFDTVLAVSRSVRELNVSDWEDIKRVDVRPDKGMMKVVSHNDWEVQIDSSSAEILQVAFRRSDIIESIHDGSWFADFAKLWIFLPVAILLFLMWCSGVILLYTTMKSKYKKRESRTASNR